MNFSYIYYPIALKLSAVLRVSTPLPLNITTHLLSNTISKWFFYQALHKYVVPFNNAEWIQLVLKLTNKMWRKLNYNFYSSNTLGATPYDRKYSPVTVNSSQVQTFVGGGGTKFLYFLIFFYYFWRVQCCTIVFPLVILNTAWLRRKLDIYTNGRVRINSQYSLVVERGD